MAKAPQVITTEDGVTLEPVVPEKKKNEKKCKKVYINADGTESSHASLDTVALDFRFMNGNTHQCRPEDYPANIRHCYEFFGISEKNGNSFAGSDSVDDAEEKFLNINELLMGGEWIKVGERVGGAPSTQLSEAFCRYLLQIGKKTPNTDEGRRQVAEKVKGWNKAERKDFSERPEIAVHLAAIKSENAAKTLAALTAKAAGVESTVDVADFE